MLEFVWSALSYVVPFVAVLTLVVTIHELGHFWAARAFGVAVDQFSIGFGRAIARWTDKTGVEWKIGWIPLGGYVRFAEDDNVTSVPDHKTLETLKADIHRREGAGAERKYFHFKPVWQRAIIVAAGPFANFVLAVLLFAGLLSAIGENRLPPRIDAVAWYSPAEQAGFRAGDVIVEANGRQIDNFLDVYEIVGLRGGTATEFIVERRGERVRILATPERRMTTDRSGVQQRIGYLGLQPPPASEATRRHYGPVEALGKGVQRTWSVLDTTLAYLGRLITGKESGDQLSGPLRIAQASGSAAAAGADSGEDFGEKARGVAIALLSLTAVLSVGIGFMNLLPVPVLDGGHLVFYAYEAAARRPVGAGLQAASYRVGLALLLGLMVFATWNDLQQLRVFKFLGGLFS
jgi:regulator of sigma E protease